MDINSLKLHLIQKIIATDDPVVLEKIRRILNEAEINVVAEGEAPYFKLEDRMYSADEVRDAGGGQPIHEPWPRYFR